MGLRGDAAIVGFAEHGSERRFTGTPTMTLEQWAELAALFAAAALSRHHHQLPHSHRRRSHSHQRQGDPRIPCEPLQKRENASS